MMQYPIEILLRCIAPLFSIEGRIKTTGRLACMYLSKWRISSFDLPENFGPNFVIYCGQSGTNQSNRLLRVCIPVMVVPFCNSNYPCVTQS